LNQIAFTEQGLLASGFPNESSPRMKFRQEEVKQVGIVICLWKLKKIVLAVFFNPE
jgi:hypothetical protein